MQSMEEIYRQHAQTVYRYLLAQTRSADLAEEMTQETFYQAVRTAGQYRGEGKLTTWLCGIAKNVWRTYRRRHPPEEELDETAPAPEVPDEAFSRTGITAGASAENADAWKRRARGDVSSHLWRAFLRGYRRNIIAYGKLGARYVLPRQGSAAKGAEKRR